MSKDKQPHLNPPPRGGLYRELYFEEFVILQELEIIIVIQISLLGRYRELIK
jgi:hypothetical protein